MGSKPFQLVPCTLQVNGVGPLLHTQSYAYLWVTRIIQIDYILCRSSDEGNIKYCKVILGESVANQHIPLVCTLISNKATKRKPSRVPRTKWWKLTEPDLRGQFTEESRKKIQQGHGRNTGLGDMEWISETGRREIARDT